MNSSQLSTRAGASVGACSSKKVMQNESIQAQEEAGECVTKRTWKGMIGTH